MVDERLVLIQTEPSSPSGPQPAKAQKWETAVSTSSPKPCWCQTGCLTPSLTPCLTPSALFQREEIVLDLGPDALADADRLKTCQPRVARIAGFEQRRHPECRA